MLGEILIAGMAAMLICIFLGPKTIDFLREKEYGQQIREEGPQGHVAKAGTPTMGGLIIFLAVTVPFLILGEYDAASLAVWGTALASAGIGVVDDWLKVSRKRSLGVPGRYKLLYQAVIAIVLSYLAIEIVGLLPILKFRLFDTSVDLNVPLELGPLVFQPAYAVLIFLVLAGASNGVNLTDGLDGLATGTSVMVFASYVLVGIWQYGQSCALTPGPKCYEVRDPLDLAVVAAALMGACFGFLWWNASPARIFMGDTGSLALGGALSGLAIVSRTELLLLLLGGLFAMITLSVILQVAFFKITGRRVFRMAPLQHHFELAGWNEVTIVIRFWIIAGLCVAFGLAVFYAEWVTGT